MSVGPATSDADGRRAAVARTASHARVRLLHRPLMRRSLPAALAALLVALNVVNNLVLAGGAYVAVNLASAVALVLLARRVGLSWADLGLSRDRLRRGARLGVLVASAITLTIAAIAAIPALADQLRPAGSALAPAEVAWSVLVRIPFGTALPEELLFRSVVLGVLLVSLGRRSAVAWSAVLFGLWHVLPTLDGASAVSGGAVVVAATVAATAAAGVGLGWLRLHADSIFAPIAAHAAINTMALLASYALAPVG